MVWMDDGHGLDCRGNGEEDPYLWLEEVMSEKSLAWVKKQNAVTVGELAEASGFRPLEARCSVSSTPTRRSRGCARLETSTTISGAMPKIRAASGGGPPMAEYRQENPDWEVVIDLDALAEAEGENWVWHGADVLEPEGRFCLVALSRGGADADVQREFDLATRQFVDDGYALPEAKSRMAWRGTDSVFVGTDFGPGSMTSSGYPRIVKQWQRGHTPGERGHGVRRQAGRHGGGCLPRPDTRLRTRLHRPQTDLLDQPVVSPS